MPAAGWKTLINEIGGAVIIYLQNDIEYKILKKCKCSALEVIEIL